MSNGDPVINNILDAFDIIINTVSEISQVELFPTIPIERETAAFPLTAIFEVPLEWQDRNRLEVNITSIHIETWYEITSGKENMYKRGKVLEALIHRAIMNECQADGLLRGLIEKIVKEVPEYNYENLELGAVIQKYTVSYLTTWGDPFTKVNY